MVNGKSRDLLVDVEKESWLAHLRTFKKSALL